MVGGVDEVEHVALAVPGLVFEAGGLRLDGDAVDLPWSMWATMEKLRMCAVSVMGPGYGAGAGGPSSRPGHGLPCCARVG